MDKIVKVEFPSDREIIELIPEQCLRSVKEITLTPQFINEDRTLINNEIRLQSNFLESDGRKKEKLTRVFNLFALCFVIRKRYITALETYKAENNDNNFKNVCFFAKILIAMEKLKKEIIHSL